MSLQQTEPGLQWELIIVDNASTDDTVPFAKEIWNKLNRRDIACRFISEKQQGLNFARQAGVAAAKYGYIIFCDDDNWLGDGYVQNTFKLLSADDTIGVLGGQNIAVSDTGFPVWFADYQEFYAVGKPASSSGFVNGRSYLCGAGMATRKTIFQNAFNDRYPWILSDRKGNALSSGGDVEYCLRVLLQGYNLFYSEELILKHFIPATRLTAAYRDALSKGIEESRKVALEYADAVKIKNLKKQDKLTQLSNAVKDIVKSFIKRQKPSEFSRKILFYFFNIGYRKRDDLKIIKRFYNA